MLFMRRSIVKVLRITLWLAASATVVIATLVAWGGSATRPVNPPLAHFNKSTSLQFERLEHNRGDQQDLVVLAFSGGGTRAAAFSYGVLEALRRVEVPTTSGRQIRMLDEGDVITGISGGSCTAYSYGRDG